MELIIRRVYKKADYTIGKMYITGQYFCDTLEDTDRNLDDSMPEAEVIRLKVYGKTAIPRGTYHVTTDIVSSAMRWKLWAKPYDGKIPRILSVKGFEGVLIHPGNNVDDTLGCVLVGENKVKGGVIKSQETFHKLMSILKGQDNILLTIQ